jgi:hypothetical protein
MRVARVAGIRHAIAAIVSSTIGTATKVSGSPGLTPNKAKAANSPSNSTLTREYAGA